MKSLYSLMDKQDCFFGCLCVVPVRWPPDGFTRFVLDRRPSFAPERLYEYMEDWFPEDSHTSKPFYGVNRNVYPARLSGRRFACSTSNNVRDTFRELMSEDANVDIDSLFAPPILYQEIGQDNIDCRFGPVKVYEDPWCPDGKAFALELKSWRILTFCGIPVQVACDLPGNNFILEM